MRKLTSFWGIVLFLSPIACFAIGLGNIKLKSALNQPFDAEVKILDLGSTSINEVHATLASGVQFKKFGLNREDYLSKFHFLVTRDASNKPIIHITTADAIDEPIVSFLLNLNSPEGTLLRQYTVFLDPPDYEQMQPMVAPPIVPEGVFEQVITPPVPFSELAVQEMAPVAVVETVVSQPPPEPVEVISNIRPVPQSAPKPVKKPVVHNVVSKQSSALSKPVKPAPLAKTATSPNSSGTVYGPTKVTDTLWKIASQFIGSGVSTQQAMVAIYYRNPEAFAHNNMNGLKTGYKIVVPSRQEMMAIKPKQANSEIVIQDNNWTRIMRGETIISVQAKPVSVEATPVKKQPEIAPAKPAAKPPIVVESTLPVPPPQNLEPAVPQSNPAQEAPVQPKTPFVTESPEISPALEPIKLNLSAPAGIEGHYQITDNLTDDEKLSIQALQTKLALTAEALKSTRETNEILKNRLNKLEVQQKALQQTLQEKTDIIHQLQGQSVQPSDQVSSKRTVTSAIAVPPQEKQQEKSLLFKNHKLLLSLAIALLIVALFLGGLYWQHRRYKQSHQVFEDEFNHPIVEEEKPKIELEVGNVPLQPTDATDAAVPQEQHESSSNLQEEIKVLIAYARYSQAEKLIKSTLQMQPDNIKLKLSLLEIYVLTNNQNDFEQCLTELPAELDEQDPAAWSRVALMKKQMELKKQNLEKSAHFSEPTLPIQETIESPVAKQEVTPRDVPSPDERERIEPETTLTEPSEFEKRVIEEPQQTESVIAKTPEEDTNYLVDFDIDMKELVKEPKETQPPVQENMIEFESPVSPVEPARELEAIEEVASPQSALERELATKLDLARVYIDMEDYVEVNTLLNEVIEKGTSQQKAEALELFKRIKQ